MIGSRWRVTVAIIRWGFDLDGVERRLEPVGALHD